MRSTIAACALLAAATLAAPAHAHHSAGLIYRLDEQVTVEGDVTRFELGNPHLRIYFTRTAEDGTQSEWMAEGGSRTILMRRGWGPETIKYGDHVVIHGNPSRDGSNVVHVQRLILPDGRELYSEDAGPGAVENLRARSRSAGDE